MKCDICDEEFKEGGLEELQVDGWTKHVCSDCKSDLYKCDWCEGYSVDSLARARNSDNHRIDVCNHCLENDFDMCDYCGEYRPQDYVRYLERYDRRVCDICLDDNYFCCDGCNEWYHCDDGRHGYCENCSSSDHDGCDYPDGWNIQRTDKDDDESPIFGVELEVGFNDSDFCEDDMMLYDWVSYVRDYSIEYDYNMEFLIHPMSWSWIKANWTKIDKLLNKIGSCGGKVDSSCGIHIHVNRSAFKDFAHLHRFFKLIHCNYDYFFNHSGRKYESSMDRWAHFYPDGVNSCYDSYGLANMGKYCAVNLVHNNTVEIRIFGATLRTERYLEHIRLIRNVFNYTANPDYDMDINVFSEYHSNSDTVLQQVLLEG